MPRNRVAWLVSMPSGTNCNMICRRSRPFDQECDNVPECTIRIGLRSIETQEALVIFPSRRAQVE
jgi:hypothetical protein